MQRQRNFCAAAIHLPVFQRMIIPTRSSPLSVLALAVATSAVRDATNGAVFLARLAEIDLDVELLSGEEEAAMAGYGVLAGIPNADGLVGDLGGGSLELTRVSNGTVTTGRCLVTLDSR